jgi:hypothetical protein
MLNSANPAQRTGLSNFGNASLSTGANTIVAAGANLNGILVRTCLLISPSGGLVDLRNGSLAVYFAASNGALQAYNGPGIVIPPGVALIVNSSIGGGSAYLTYDIL